MATTQAGSSIRLNEDIFYHLVDILVGYMRLFTIPLAIREHNVLSLGRSLRLICRSADARLRPYMYPILEIVSSQQAAQLLFEGSAGKSLVRTMTLRPGVKNLYVSSILHTLENYARDEPLHRRTQFWSLKKFVVDNRTAASHLSTRSPRRFEHAWLLGQVRDLAFIGSRSNALYPQDDFHYYLDAATTGREYCRVERLALDGDPWAEGHKCPSVRVVVVRWLPTSGTNTRSYIDNLHERHPLLTEVMLVYSLEQLNDSTNAIPPPPTPQEKWDFVQSRGLTVVEVHADVYEQEMETWFAWHVRNDTIWDLQGDSWRGSSLTV